MHRKTLAAGWPARWIVALTLPSFGLTAALGQMPPPDAPSPVVASDSATPNAEAEPRELVEWTPFDPVVAEARLSDWATQRGGNANAATTVLTRWREIVSSGTAGVQPTHALLAAASSDVPRLGETLAKLDSFDLAQAEQLLLEMSSASFDPMINDHLRLWAAIRMTHEGYYDEALELLATLDPSKVIDPAALLFYRGVVEHQLVKLADARWSLESLVTPNFPLPARYEQIAKLLLKDLEQVEPESLGAIARQMNDVHRRLSLGSADKQVQLAEDDVMKSLDKMIEKIEEQQRQQQQMQQQAMNPNTPMEESRLTPMQAQGDADVRDIGRGTGWGDLPPKERERVMQQIGREFPAHYREVIEEYFRRLATDQRDDDQS